MELTPESTSLPENRQQTHSARENQSTGRGNGSKDGVDSLVMAPLPKWEELVPGNQPPPPPTASDSVTGNIIYNYYEQPASIATRQLMPGMPTAGGRFVSATRPPVMMRPPTETPLRLIPVILTRTVVHWLRPISKHCMLDQFFRSVNETMFMEALGLFCIFYYNRPPNRAAISMLQLFRMVMELGGYHSVCEKKQWNAVASAFVNQKGSQVDLTVAQQALCSLYRINLLPFEEFHFRGTRAESLPGIDLNVLRGRTEQWKMFLQQQQQQQMHQNLTPAPIAPQPVPPQQSQQPSPKRTITPQSTQSPTQSQQQQPKRLPELLRVIGEKRTIPTKLHDISGVTLPYLEKCYKSGGEAQRIFVWNSLLPIVANGKLSASDAGALQYLAIQLEAELSTFLSGKHYYMQRITELDFVSYIGNVEVLYEPCYKAEQLMLLLSCLVNIGNFAVFFSKRPQTMHIMEAFLIRANFLTQDSWERLLEAFELVQRFSKALSPEFVRRFHALACEDLRHSVDLMASRSVLSLQLGEVGKQEEVSAFPFNVLPRRTFFLLSILNSRINKNEEHEFQELERTIIKLLGAAYYKVQRQISSKQQKLKKETNATFLHQRLMMAALEDYGYVELCLMILKKMGTCQRQGVLLRMFGLLWDFWISFAGIKGAITPQSDASVHFSSLYRIPKLLAPLIAPREIDVAQWLVDYAALPKGSLVHQFAEPLIDTLVEKITLSEHFTQDEFDWQEKEKIDLRLSRLGAENSDWLAFHSELFTANGKEASKLFKEDGDVLMKKV